MEKKIPIINDIKQYDKKCIEELKSENNYLKQKIELLEFELNRERQQKEFYKNDNLERQKVEEELGEFAEKYHNLFELAPVGIAILDKNGCFLECNRDIARLFGIKRELLYQRNFFDLDLDVIRKDGSHISKQEWASLRAMKENTLIENTEEGIVKKDGKITWINITAVPCNIKNIREIIIFQDITKRIETEKEKEKAEKEIIRLKERLELALQSAKMGLWDWDLRNNYKTWDKGMFSLYEMDKDSVKNAHEIWEDTIHPEDKNHCINKLKKTIHEGKEHDTEFRIILSNGNIKYIKSFGKIIRDKNGNPERIVGINYDITESKNHLRQLVSYTEELKEANIIKDKFFSIVAHDLKGPFTVLMSYVDLIQKNIYNKKIHDIRDDLKIIHKVAQNTYSLLENLLVWAGAQTKGIKFNPEQIKLFELIEETLILMESHAIEKGIKLFIEIDKDYSMSADKNMLQTVIRNIISNAIKFTYPNGEVRISAKSSKDQHLISIKDNGTGMEKEDIEKLFKIDQKFHKYGTKEEKGTGLGLIICKEFIEKHGGNILVESKVGVGSNFKIAIPKEMCL
ncbi:MAG: ATP-binding protein [Bacteroidota bacterium]|nr:ATP-binding protein [Bacteroidota bacterium]